MARTRVEITSSWLADLLDDAGYTARAYSGRAMFGAQCVAVEVDAGEVLAVGSKLAHAAAEDADAGGGDWLDVLERVSDLMTRARVDDLGRGKIVYWPDVDWTGEEGPDESDDDEE